MPARRPPAPGTPPCSPVGARGREPIPPGRTCFQSRRVERKELVSGRVVNEVPHLPCWRASLRVVHSVTINPDHRGGVDLVLLHGFANGGGCFFRQVAELGMAGRTHLVDWRGAGLSGRPRYLPETEAEAIDYFVEGGERPARRVPTGESPTRARTILYSAVSASLRTTSNLRMMHHQPPYDFRSDKSCTNHHSTEMRVVFLLPQGSRLGGWIASGQRVDSSSSVIVWEPLSPRTTRRSTQRTSSICSWLGLQA